MKSSLCSLLLIFLSHNILIVSSAAEHRAAFNDLADQVGKEIAGANLRSVAVADFQISEGKSSDLCWYMANQFSDALLRRDPKFRVLDRAELKDAKVTTEDLSSPELLRRLGTVWGVDAIVTGTVDVVANPYQVTVSVRKVADGAVVVMVSEPIPHSRILDLLRPQGLDMGGTPPVTGGTSGAGVPICTLCPVPGYSEKASKAKIQSATVVLLVVVSPAGRVARIKISKNPGFGLADQAIESVSEWQFKPAVNKEGTPVPVEVPAEISFHMSRN